MLQQAGDTQVPAQRSRTTGWRRCLEQIHKRHGSIEIAIDTSDGSGSGEDRGTGGDLVFRSKVLDLPGQTTEDEQLRQEEIVGGNIFAASEHLPDFSGVDNNNPIVDSGASYSVCPKSYAPETPTVQSTAIKLQQPDGKVLRRYGKKKVYYENWNRTRLLENEYQVADVTTPLISVKDRNNRGQLVCFGPNCRK